VESSQAGSVSLCPCSRAATVTATATASNAKDAEDAENGRLQVNGNVKSRDVLGALGVLGVE
jgi:hypothetical protein